MFPSSPYREYIVIATVSVALGLNAVLPGFHEILFLISVFGSVPTFWSALDSIFKRKVTIDTFNVFALGISFAVGEIRSAAFIVLMLAFASLLDWRTSSKTKNAVEELLRLKPDKAFRIQGADAVEISVDDVRTGDILLVKEGARIPVDGVIVFGSVLINEAPVTGESVPVSKTIGDYVMSGTLNDSGICKIRATAVGKDSTLERMAELIREAEKNKSRSEKLADRFAVIFLPVVIAIGAITYALTRDLTMTSAIFLVACADDMAVAIPLAVTASIGKAASRGVIIKGSEYLDALAHMDTLVLDKTGTLTYGSFEFQRVEYANNVSEKYFWEMVGLAEQFSEHPVGRTIFQEARKRSAQIETPLETKVFKGSGIWARTKSAEVAIGDESIFSDMSIPVSPLATSALLAMRSQYGGTAVAVLINKVFVGVISVADVPRTEAQESIHEIKNLGVKEAIMFTGDNQAVAEIVAGRLGMTSFVASMSPEDKLRKLEALTSKSRIVGMVGDGINDAPALARAHVGIAMGRGGSAVAVEAADIIILTDNLKRIPEMIRLGKNTASVIHWDMVIWVASNALGFALVLTGFAGPALAAFYNFATDFFPLINSTRLFRKDNKALA